MDLQNLTDPDIVPGSLKETANGWEWEMKNGVRISSCNPPMPYRWWDMKQFHLIWSYSSWTTLLLAQAGTLADEKNIPYVGRVLKAPRNYLKGRGWW